MALQNVSSWSDGETQQAYALAIALERDEDHREVFSDLRLFVEAQAEIEVQIEAQAELGVEVGLAAEISAAEIEVDGA